MLFLLYQAAFPTKGWGEWQTQMQVRVGTQSLENGRWSRDLALDLSWALFLGSPEVLGK